MEMSPLYSLALAGTLKVKKQRFPEATIFLRWASYPEQESLVKSLPFSAPLSGALPVLQWPHPTVPWDSPCAPSCEEQLPICHAPSA